MISYAVRIRSFERYTSYNRKTLRKTLCQNDTIRVMNNIIVFENNKTVCTSKLNYDTNKFN